MTNTIDFYDRNAKNYISDTRGIEFTVTQDEFLKHLHSGDRIYMLRSNMEQRKWSDTAAFHGYD